MKNNQQGAAMLDGLPEWAGNLMYAALGGLSALALGLIRAWVDTSKIVSTDRAEFTRQVLERLNTVEASLMEERAFCEKKLNDLHTQYEARFQARDEIITELRGRVTQLEKLSHGDDGKPGI